MSFVTLMLRAKALVVSGGENVFQFFRFLPALKFLPSHFILGIFCEESCNTFNMLKYFSENLLVMLEVLGSVSMKPGDFREFMGLVKPSVDGEKVSF